MGAISDFPNQSKSDRWLSGISLESNPLEELTIKLKSDLDRQSNLQQFGISPGYAGAASGIYTARNHDHTSLLNSLSAEYLLPTNNGKVEFRGIANHQYFDQAVHRIQAFGFADPLAYPNLSQANTVTDTDLGQQRTVYELAFGARYDDYYGLHFGISHRSYFSSTLDPDRYSNFLPTIEGAIDFGQLLYLGFFNNLKLHFNLGRTLREASLLYNDWSYASVNNSIIDYSQVYEAADLFSHEELLPEIEDKLELGLDVQTEIPLSAEFVYYRNQTDNLIAPTFGTLGQVVLSNAATVTDAGFTASVRYRRYFYSAKLNINSRLNWHTYSSRVQNLNSAMAWLPLAGFSEVQTVLAPGKDLGAIYGSSYQRNDEGEIMIGNDGFPLKDSSLNQTGGTIPAWTLGWSAEVSW